MRVRDILVGNQAAKNQGQMSVEEARAAMIAAGEAPSKYPGGERKLGGGNTSNPVVTQTPTVVRSAVAQRNEEVLTAGGPTEVVATLTYVNGDVRELVVKDKDALVATVDAESKRLKDSGQPTRIAVSYFLRPVQEQSSSFVVEATNEPARQTNKNSAVERADTKDFTAEIRQEGGQWVGELTYKNGAGTERFTAPTKNALTLQMLVGKGHASVKVRKVIREQKLGVELDKSYLFEGLTQEEFDSLPNIARQELIDKKAMEASLAFRSEHPEYLNTNENWQIIKRFLDKRQLPYTFVNLEYAYDSLTDDEMLQVREEAPTVVTEAPRTEDSVVVAATPAQTAPAAAAAAPAPQLRKRGTTGLQPGFSSAGNTELEQTEGGNKPRELSEAELRALPLSEHKKLYKATLKQPNRQF